MNSEVKVVYLTLIAGRKQKDALLCALSKSGGRLVNVIYGKGSVKASYLRDVFGFVAEENKVVITCLATKEKSDEIIGMLIEKFHFNEPNTGIAFTIPVEHISF